MTGTRTSQWNGDAAGALTMIWKLFFGDVADVPVVSPTFQSRWEKLRSVQLLRISLMHRCHVPVDAGTSPSLTTILKPGLKRALRHESSSSSSGAIRSQQVSCCESPFLSIFNKSDAFTIPMLSPNFDVICPLSPWFTSSTPAIYPSI